MDAFKIKLLKCKARIYLVMHQLKLCKREWKTLVSLGTPAVRYRDIYWTYIPFICPAIKILCPVLWFLYLHRNFVCFQNISTVFLRANLEYLRGNYKKAIKLLNSVTSENLDFKYAKFTAILYRVNHEQTCSA